MFGYKVIPCSKRYRHDWSVCPFAHVGEMAARRDPKLYLPIFCYHSKQRLPCPRGEQCPHAHNLFEYWLHPARYRTELCQFGMACTRPVCFFAHDESQLRNTGVPGGPQPIVAPPEPLVTSPQGAAPHVAQGSPPPGLSGGPNRAFSQDQVLLTSISEAAVHMHMHDAAAAAAGGDMAFDAMCLPAPQSISDVLPVLGSHGRPGGGRGAAAAFGAHAPARALKSMPLPRVEWHGGAAEGPHGAAALHQALVAQQVAYAADPMPATIEQAAVFALARSQSMLPHRGGGGGGGGPHTGLVDARAKELRRSISEAAAMAQQPLQQQPPLRRQGPAQPRLSFDSSAQAHQQAQGDAPSDAATAALLGHLQRKLTALQFTGAEIASSASAPLAHVQSHSSPLPPIREQHAPLMPQQSSDMAVLMAALQQQQQQELQHQQLQHQQQQLQQQLQHEQEMQHHHQQSLTVAALAASAAAQQRQQRQASPREVLDQQVAPPRRESPQWSDPTSPCVADGAAAADGADGFCRAPGSRAPSPRSAGGSADGSAAAAAALMMVGGDSMSIETLQEQLSNPSQACTPAARRSSAGGACAAAAAAAAGPPPAAGAGMGREAAAQLLAQMPESAVRDLLRVISAGQPVVSQPAA